MTAPPAVAKFALPPTMHTLLLASSLFATAFLLHLLVWRIRLPGRQSAALLAIFTGCLVCWLLTAWFLPGNPTAPRDGAETIHVALVHIALSLAYVVAYSAIEHRSPSMTLLLAVAGAGSRGLSRDQLRGLLVAALPVETRIEAMVREGMLVGGPEGYSLSPKGQAWEGVLGGWRRLLGLPRGG
ncbi:MAG: hypothetical protein ACOYK7_01080 [Pirellulales bacterium]